MKHQISRSFTQLFDMHKNLLAALFVMLLSCTAFISSFAQFSLITQGGYSFSLGDLIIATFFGSAHTLYVEWTALCISFLLIIIISSSDTNEHFSIQRMMRFEKKTRFWIYSYINIIVSSLFLIAVYIMTYVILLICTGNSPDIATLNVDIFIYHTVQTGTEFSLTAPEVLALLGIYYLGLLFFSFIYKVMKLYTHNSLAVLLSVALLVLGEFFPELPFPSTLMTFSRLLPFNPEGYSLLYATLYFLIGIIFLNIFGLIGTKNAEFGGE